jgi:hypothetical protein
VMVRTQENEIVEGVVLGLGIFDRMMDLKWAAAETVSAVTTDPIGSCQDRLDNVRGDGDPLDFLLDKGDFGLGIVCSEGSFREIAKSAHGVSVLVDTRDDVCIESETEECVVCSFIHASSIGSLRGAAFLGIPYFQHTAFSRGS